MLELQETYTTNIAEFTCLKKRYFEKYW